jgi:hypothetical protein
MWENRCSGEILSTAPAAIKSYLNGTEPHLTFRNGVLEWASEQGFLELWEGQPEFEAKTCVELDQAYNIFRNPALRAPVGMMILSRADDEEIVEMIQERFEIEMTQSCLDLYVDLFWNIDLMDREEWIPFIEQLPLKEERNMLALALNGKTTDECRDMVGLNAEVSLDAMLSTVLQKSYQNLLDAYVHPNPDAANIDLWHGHWMKAWDRSNKNLKDADAANPLGTGDFRALFSVQPTKTKHVSLTDIKGHLSPNGEATAKQAAAGKEDES